MPWHHLPHYLDSQAQLAPARARFEREANYAAARLLFQQDVFATGAGDVSWGMAGVKQLAELFGASLHAAFWHFIERPARPALGLVLDHSPLASAATAHRFLITNSCASPRFRQRFSFWMRVHCHARSPRSTTPTSKPRG